MEEINENSEEFIKFLQNMTDKDFEKIIKETEQEYFN